MLLNARPGYLSDGACDHLLRRMLSHLSESLLASDACLRRMVLVSLEVQRVAWAPARLRTFAGEVIRCDALSDRFHVQEGRTRRL